MGRVWQLGIVALCLGACGESEQNAPGFLAPSPRNVGGAAGSPPLAGTAGAAAKPAFDVNAAVDECTRACEALPYRLPSALCEDWNTRPWDPQFCHRAFPQPCSEYCSELYAVVSPDCAEALSPVIRCVAPTYAKVNVDLSTECWLMDCRDVLYTMTSACYRLRDQLEAARAKWEASGMAEYDLRYDLGGGAVAQVLVRSGADPVVTPAGATAWTVAKLFAGVETYLSMPGVAPSVAYDPVLGHATYLGHYQGCNGALGDVQGVTVTPTH